MIEFDPMIQNPRLLKKAMKWAMKKKDHIPSLTALAPKLTLVELTDLARSWQDAGFGRLIEVSEEGRRSVLFSLNDNAQSVSESLEKRSLLGRLASVSRSDWISLAALVVSTLSAYFTYLTVRSQ